MATGLPIEIFSHHIFLKLPVKSLSRFKCVCKEWNNLLRDPQIAKMHLHHATQQHYSHKLLLHSFSSNRISLERFYSVDLQRLIRSNGGDDVFDAVILLPFPLEDHPPLISTTIVGSINGMLCVSLAYCWEGVCKSLILIWNPTTRDYKVLPPLTIQKFDSLGFAYDSLAEDYKIVSICHDKIYIYSLKTNSWKLLVQKDGQPIALPSRLLILSMREYCCYVDGCIYWLCYKYSCEDNVKKFVILCFDLKGEKFREMQPPRNCGCRLRFIALNVLGGCLSMFQFGHGNKLVIWTMKKNNNNKKDEDDDDDKYYWTKIMTINASCLVDGISDSMLFPICLLNDGKVLLKVDKWNGKKLVSYDPKTKTMSFKDYDIRSICKGGRYNEDPSDFCHLLYIESLLLPSSYI